MVYLKSLGPILSNNYVNDLTEMVDECFIVQYTDDTQYLENGNIDNLPEFIKRLEQLNKKNNFGRNGF